LRKARLECFQYAIRNTNLAPIKVRKAETAIMDEDVTRRLVKGLLTLALTTLATWLASYITDRLLGPESEEA
jgi:hypothetical protein